LETAEKNGHLSVQDMVEEVEIITNGIYPFRHEFTGRALVFLCTAQKEKKNTQPTLGEGPGVSMAKATVSMISDVSFRCSH